MRRRVAVMYEATRGDSEPLYKGFITAVTPVQHFAYANILKLLPNSVAMGEVSPEDESPLLELPYNSDSGVDFFFVSSRFYL